MSAVPEKVKSVEELLNMGGKFYPMSGESWCDTALHSWKLVPEKGGYVRQDDSNPICHNSTESGSDMIGGTDIILPAVGDEGSLDLCVRVVLACWPQARFENADTGEEYDRFGDIPFGKVTDLFVYKDADIQNVGDPSLYLLRRPGDITAVVEDPEAHDVKAMLEGFRTTLGTELLRSN